MEIQFVASVSAVVTDVDTSKRLFLDALRLPLEDRDGYFMTEKLDGVKHFGIWPLIQAAQSCFGTTEWPAQLTRPQASVEFEVARPSDVAPALDELRGAGFEPIHDAKEEPWGQVIGRVISPDGLIVGISYAPWFHE